MYVLSGFKVAKSRLRIATAIGSIATTSLLTISPAMAQDGATAATAAPGPVVNATEANPAAAGEIIVTAQKRREDVKNVPLSISVLGGGALEQQRVVDFQDLGRIVPGLAVTNTGASSLSRLSLRGIASDQGTSTVGVYLEDISLTIPNLFFTGATLPELFDIDHVEVLRGPQGTLFGASSLGGAIRFIPSKPKLDRVEGEISGDISKTKRAGTNYSVRGVINLPIVNDMIALRVGAVRRDDSGFVTRYDGAGEAHGDVGGERSTSVRATLLIEPDDTLSIEPALLWQKVNNNGTSIFQISTLPDYRQDKVTAEKIRDKLIVPSLTIRKDFGALNLTSVTSYVQRDNNRRMDGQIYNSEFVASVVDPTFGNNYDTIAGLPGPYDNNVRAKQFSQEIRLGSPSTEESGGRFEWQVGGYYFRQNIRTLDDEYVTGLGSALRTLYPQDPAAILGAPLNNDVLGFFHYTNRSREYALFAQASFLVLPKLKLTVGGRQSWARYGYDISEGGFLALGTPATDHRTGKEQPFIPKASLSYEASRQATVYATVSKGYRLGGVNSPLPTSCGTSLQQFGITSTDGIYDSDSLWSYEGGAKLRLFNNRLSINASGFYIDWSSIQQRLSLNSCGYVTTVNAGDARSYGGEAEITARVTNDLTLTLSGAVNDAKLSDAAAGTGAASGQYLPFVPRYNFSAAADYTRTLGDDLAVHAHGDVNQTGKSNGTFRTTDADYRRPAYTVVNVNIGASTGPIDVSVFVRNLLNNDKIIQRPSALFTRQGLIVRPRTAGVSATYKF
jgi:iron complex outermembrane receptor protein